jgi:hypothetical protein
VTLITEGCEVRHKAATNKKAAPARRPEPPSRLDVQNDNSPLICTIRGEASPPRKDPNMLVGGPIA